MRRKFCLLSASLLILIWLNSYAFACSCIGPGKPCQAYGAASAVFVGTVIAVRTAERATPVNRDNIDWTPRTFKFSVEQSFLGAGGREAEVATGMGGGDCGYEFKVGERYLVYAYLWKDRLTTGICS